MPTVKITLNEIRCVKTEDITGGDEFYIIAALGKGSPPNFDVGAVTKGPWTFNDGDKRSLNVGLFYETVDYFLPFVFGIRCYDKDASEDLTDAKLATAVKATSQHAKAAGAIAEEAMAGSGEAKLAALIVDAIDGTVRALWDFIKMLVSLDKDDFLGTEDPPFWLSIPGQVNPATNQWSIQPGFQREHQRTFVCREDGCLYWVTYTVSIAS